MKFNYKKVASVLASAVMLSSTVGFAAAASNYPAPFVSSGSADGVVVVGSSGAYSDVMAAVDVSQKLTAMVSVTTTGGSTTTATGGDSINLGTSSRKLYYGDQISAGRTSVSSSELPNVLVDGTFTDLTGTKYTYTQTVMMGSAASAFSNSGGDIKDPTILLNVETAAGALYNYTLSFNKNVNVSDPTNVQGQKINILGVDYVIGTSSTNMTIYLYGSGETATVKSGEEAKVTVAETEHTIELVTTSDSSHGTLKVDGISKTVTKGSTYAYPGGLNIYVKDVIHPVFAGDVRQTELILGANTLKLVNGQAVKTGADETTIRGTEATITAAGNGIISAIKVAVGMPKSQTDHLAAGESYNDPVFGGMKVTLAGTTPTLDSTNRGKITVRTDNTQYAYVKLTGAKSATEKEVTFVYDNDTSSSGAAPLLAWQSTVTSNGKGKIHVYEGEASREGDYIVVNAGDAGAILEVSSISATSTDATGTVEFLDVLTGDKQIITLTNSTGTFIKTGVSMFGGTGYTINVNPAATPLVNITWNAGGVKALFPRIKLKNGGWLALMAPTTVANATSVILPDGLTTLALTGTTLHNASQTYTVNGITWNTTGVTDPLVYGLNNPGCSFSATFGAAILVIEPKRWNDASYGNYLCIPLQISSNEISIKDPVFNGSNSGWVTWSSDTYKKQSVDQYGTLTTKEDRTNENGVATIAYPDSQMLLDVLFTAKAATVTPGAGGGTGTGGQVLVVKDTEVDSVKDKNLLVVGGSCINSVAAKILGSDSPLCGDDFSAITKVSAGGYIIKTVESPYNANKIAMLVAGYNAADTENAVQKVLTGVATDKDTETTYPEVTSGTTTA
ncbi:MAG: hypothetical protein Q8N99_06890 [Nanoarchaeota archaeon]|nr:hypothetical protein [Nanoarchaeota archaeon]